MIKNGLNARETTTPITIKLWYFRKFDINFSHNFLTLTMCLFDRNSLVKCVVKGFIAHKWNHSKNKSNNLMLKFTTCHSSWPIFRMETFNKISNLFNEWQWMENGKWQMAKRKYWWRNCIWTKKKKRIHWIMRLYGMNLFWPLWLDYLLDRTSDRMNTSRSSCNRLQ